MSFIGSLQQFSLLAVLQKIEDERKNGVLIVKQEAQWVELSFRYGQLMCIGPVRVHRTLAERLLQAGVISQKALQDLSALSDSPLQNETRTVVALIDLGYLNRENLYTWAAQEAASILQVLVGWSSGEVYFEEGLQPPPDRLLIALTVSSLLPSPISNTEPPYLNYQKQADFRTTRAQVPDALTLHDPSQFYGAPGMLSASDLTDPNERYNAGVLRNTDALSASAYSVNKPGRLTDPLAPHLINTALMQPHMVICLTDLIGIHDQNLLVRLTPEQWRLFTLADCSTTLQMACQQLMISREQVCQLAGELVALNLITLHVPDTGLLLDSNILTANEANASFVYNSQTQRSQGAFTSPPIETHSQWGNGGTGATFVLGNGWVVASSTSQSQQSGDINSGRSMDYATAGGL